MTALRNGAKLLQQLNVQVSRYLFWFQFKKKWRIVSKRSYEEKGKIRISNVFL